MTNLQALAYAIKMEQESAKYYQHYASKCTSKNAKTLFEALAKMEVEHYEILEKQYTSLYKGGNWVDINLDIFNPPTMIFDIASEKITESEIESKLSDITILKMAYLMENDLAVFYKEWSEKTENLVGKEFLKKLSSWEFEHFNMLHKEYKNLIEDNWFEMGFAPF